MNDLVFLDTETTSLSAEHGEIWEFAGIRRTPDGVETRTLFQIECDLGLADPFSLNIGKYYERFGKNGDLRGRFSTSFLPENGEILYKDDAAKVISEFTRGASIVGNVVSFDSERMERLLRSQGECPGWHYHVIDIEPILVGYLKAMKVLNPSFLATDYEFTLPYKSETLSKAVGVDLPTDEERHTAMGDAEWVKRQWDAVFGDHLVF